MQRRNGYLGKRLENRVVAAGERDTDRQIIELLHTGHTLHTAAPVIVQRRPFTHKGILHRGKHIRPTDALNAPVLCNIAVVGFEHFVIKILRRRKFRGEIPGPAACRCKAAVGKLAEAAVKHRISHLQTAIGEHLLARVRRAQRDCAAVILHRIIHERLRIVAPGVVDRVADLIGTDGVIFVERLLRFDYVGVLIRILLAYTLVHGRAPGVLNGLFKIGLIFTAVVDLIINHHVLAVHIRIHAVPVKRDPINGETIDRIRPLVALVHKDIVRKEKIVRRKLRAVGTAETLLQADRDGRRSVRPGRAGDLGRGTVPLHGTQGELRHFGNGLVTVRLRKERAEYPVHFFIGDLSRLRRRLRLIGKNEIRTGNGRFGRRDHAHNAVHRERTAGEREQDRYQQSRSRGPNGFLHTNAPFILLKIS